MSTFLPKACPAFICMYVVVRRHWDTRRSAQLAECSLQCPHCCMPVKTGNQNTVMPLLPRLLPQIEGILTPVRGVRDAQVRAGITPVNHARNNVHAVREVSRMNSLKKLQETEDAAASATRSSRPPSRRTSTSAGGAGPAGNLPSSRPDTAASQRNFVSENKVVAAAGVARGVKAEKRSEQQEAYLVKQDYGRYVIGVIGIVCRCGCRS